MIGNNSCEACGSTKDLVESGGQFCGGTWYLCKKCDNEATMSAKQFTQRLKEQFERKKNGSKN